MNFPMSWSLFPFSCDQYINQLKYVFCVTNRIQAVVHLLLSNRSQLMSRCGNNKVLGTQVIIECAIINVLVTF